MMMLHEAVMLEIYRQAISASELSSPRCQSRESIGSGVAGDGRFPSDESHCSTNDGTLIPTPTPSSSSPTNGLPLSASLAPVAATAALLPSHSAAVAAYLNAAAAAAQQNHLILTNPLAAAASLMQQATQSHSPKMSKESPIVSNSTALDFSTKSIRRLSDDVSDDGNLKEGKLISETDLSNSDVISPLDLSVSSFRKRHIEEKLLMSPLRKSVRENDFRPIASSSWGVVPPINPYLAAVAAANISQKSSINLDWNGKSKSLPNEATKALEKMTEMSKLCSTLDSDGQSISLSIVPPVTRHMSASYPNSTTNTTSGRHSAWQSHWLNKGADAVKDVFKCVWCKQSFPTLASLTTHMKETQHCGVSLPSSVNSMSGSHNETTSSSGVVGIGGNATSNAKVNEGNHLSSQRQNPISHTQLSSSSSSVSNSSTTSSSKSDINLLIKETMPLPRKLVRGQDVWLGKGAEQTRQILKCMWCGQSFRSLAEMTSHMQETQHYTNIISQEQIISWKSTDDKNSSNGATNLPLTTLVATSPNANPASTQPPIAMNNALSNSTVSAVLTCRVCDQPFSTLKELSDHMIKNCHYKEHMMRSSIDGNTCISKKCKQTREKRKKSLPVRKLLELERAQHDYKANSLDSALKPLRDFAASTKITCEKCGDKIETILFVEHIRQCLGATITSQGGTNLKTSYPRALPTEHLTSPETPSSQSDDQKTLESNSSSVPSAKTEILYPVPKESDKVNSSPSVLNAIEQLIEKSFETRSRQANTFGTNNQSNTPLGSSILKRLGIDDIADYTKPLIDPQTLRFLRSYANYSNTRDRSASESSSVSERCSSIIEPITPERISENSIQIPTSLTPDKLHVLETQIPNHKKNDERKVKSEPIRSLEKSEILKTLKEKTQKISVKKEFFILEEEDVKPDEEIINRISPKIAGRTLSFSNGSDQSDTPKSDSPRLKKKVLPISSSLNALSSMFDNLNSLNAPSSYSANTGQENNNNNLPIVNKKTNPNPLAALQKLCENTDPPAANTRSSVNNLLQIAGSTSAATTNCSSITGSGNMVTFSWACNDAIMTSSDSIIKCSFCDTPFCSKGAYRHHLSKVHFLKEDADSQSSTNLKSPGLPSSPKSIESHKSSSRSPGIQQQNSTNSTLSATATVPGTTVYDESAQSKFLKYTELAKQLSSKNS